MFVFDEVFCPDHLIRVDGAFRAIPDAVQDPPCTLLLAQPRFSTRNLTLFPGVFLGGESVQAAIGV